MEIIIKISDEDYERLKLYKKAPFSSLTSRVYEAVANGTPLPKRMLSVDLIIKTLCPKDEDYDYPCIAPSYLEEELERLLLDNAPTIIEADKAESEG